MFWWILCLCSCDTANTINTWKDCILIKILPVFPLATVYKSGASQQHGSKWWLHLHQPLQQRSCSEQCNGTITLRPAQFHLRSPFSITCHPIQHRLCWPTHLWCVLPAVQYSQISHLDGKSKQLCTCMMMDDVWLLYYVLP